MSSRKKDVKGKNEKGEAQEAVKKLNLTDTKRAAMRRRSYSTPNLIPGAVPPRTSPRRGRGGPDAITAPIGAGDTTPRSNQRVFIPVARARAQQSRDLLVLRKKPSAITRRVTPLSQRTPRSILAPRFLLFVMSFFDACRVD
jgi:hypothetical protein